ncbi:MAG: 3,4-dihydroxy-2-butanone-4-phosphate synthase [Candidatus Natronoplasma sp.]
MNEELEYITERLENGDLVMVYDADEREDEVDLVTPSEKITPQKIRTLRRDAGGLICVTVPPKTWKNLELPYLSDVFDKITDDYPLLSHMKADDIPYDERSTFSLTVNHRDTFTGITDIDRALTIQRFAELGEEILDLSKEEAQKKFGEEFRTPGHVFLLNATEGLVAQREGHTELTTALLTLTDLYPSMTICEMLSDQGDSLSEEEARVYGEENDIPLIEGKKIKEELKDNYV